MTDNPEVNSSAAGRFDLTEGGGMWVLSMERHVRTSEAALWSCLTEPSSLSRWAPFTVDRPLTATGPVRLAASHVEDAGARTGAVLEVQAPRHLVMQWGPDTLTWAVEALGEETRLALQHGFLERASAPAYAAGWQLCLTGLVELAQGGDPPVMVGERAFQYGWMDWYVWYARSFHMDSF